MWLLCGEPASDDDELNRFRSKKLSEGAEDLFYQLVHKLCKLDEIKYEHLFVDGTKLEVNANKYTIVWRKSVGKHQARLESKLVGFLFELRSRNEPTPEEAMRRFATVRTEPFVHGCGKRKTKLHRDIEQGDVDTSGKIRKIQ